MLEGIGEIAKLSDELQKELWERAIKLVPEEARKMLYQYETLHMYTNSLRPLRLTFPTDVVIDQLKGFMEEARTMLEEHGKETGPNSPH